MECSGCKIAMHRVGCQLSECQGTFWCMQCGTIHVSGQEPLKPSRQPQSNSGYTTRLMRIVRDLLEFDYSDLVSGEFNRRSESSRNLDRLHDKVGDLLNEDGD